MTYPRGVKLLLLDVAEVLEKLFPSFPEKPRFITTTPIIVVEALTVMEVLRCD